MTMEHSDWLYCHRYLKKKPFKVLHGCRWFDIQRKTISNNFISALPIKCCCNCSPKYSFNKQSRIFECMLSKAVGSVVRAFIVQGLQQNLNAFRPKAFCSLSYKYSKETILVNFICVLPIKCCCNRSPKYSSNKQSRIFECMLSKAVGSAVRAFIVQGF